MLIDGEGRPVCSEIWLGNRADVTTLIPVIDRLHRRSLTGGERDMQIGNVLLKEHST